MPWALQCGGFTNPSCLKQPRRKAQDCSSRAPLRCWCLAPPAPDLSLTCGGTPVHVFSVQHFERQVSRCPLGRSCPQQQLIDDLRLQTDALSMHLLGTSICTIIMQSVCTSCRGWPVAPSCHATDHPLQRRRT